jgi:hypothetical protein
MMMNSKSKSIKLLILLLGVALIGCFFWKGFIAGDRGTLELTQKTIWADLQSIEYEHRSDHHSTPPVLLKGKVGAEKYDVLGLPTNDKHFPFVWIVLGANAGANGIFAMPQNTHFTIECNYLGKLGASEKIDDKVRALLQEHCVKTLNLTTGAAS